MSTESKSNLGKLVMDGTYTPVGYFEEPVSQDRGEYAVAMSDGKVEVTLKRLDPLPTADEQAAIGRDVELIFQARCVLVGKPYESTGLTMKRYKPDGTRDIWVSAESAVFVVMGGSTDQVVKDKDGNVIRDTKAERLGSTKPSWDAASSMGAMRCCKGC